MRRRELRQHENANLDISLSYHRRSSSIRVSEPERGYNIDWGAGWRQPKCYTVAEKVLLELPNSDMLGVSALTLLSPPLQTKEAALASELDSIAQILYHGYGVTGERRHKEAFYRLRAAPSAGAVYPTEVYLIGSDVNEMPAGIYHFAPEDFALSRLRGGDSREALAAALPRPQSWRGKLYLGFTSISWRTAQRFGVPAYRYCLLDCGHVIGNFITVLEGLGCEAIVRGEFIDDELDDLLGIAGEEEASLAILQVGCEDFSLGSAAFTAESKTHTSESSARSPMSSAELTVERVHRSGFIDGIKSCISPGAIRHGDVALSRRAEAARTLCLSEDVLGRLESADIGEVVAGRRSRRCFASGKVSCDEIAVVLATCAVPYDADWFVSPSNGGGIDFFEQTKLYIAATAVEGLEPGVYRYSALSGDTSPVRRGEVGNAVTAACLGQTLARQAAAVIFIAPRFSEYLSRFGNRGYRYAFINAGILGERIYLAATALGLGVTGVAGIDDDAANRLCRLSGQQSGVIYALALGRPVVEGM